MPRTLKSFQAAGSKSKGASYGSDDIGDTEGFAVAATIEASGYVYVRRSR